MSADSLTYFSPPQPYSASPTNASGGVGGGSVGLPLGGIGGSMDGAGRIGTGGVSGSGGGGGGLNAFDNDAEPPLLEELGIDPAEIWKKAKAVSLPSRGAIPASLLADADLAGPLFFSTLLGFALLFQGKLHFGYIFGFGLTGCTLMWLLINLMTDVRDANAPGGIDFERCVSVLGYALLPIIGLAVLHIALPVRGVLGFGLNAAAILACTANATRFIEAMSEHGREQRYLFAYPIGLLYACFALLTVF
jgi:hypothetical protein